VTAILAAPRILQRSSGIFRRIVAELFLERRGTREFSGVNAKKRGIERLMPGERIQQREKVRLVRGGKKTDQALGLIVESFHVIGRRLRHRDKRGEWNQILRRDRLRVRFGIVTASAPVTGLCAFGNILCESFIQPTRNPVCIKSVEDEMSDFVPESVAAEFVRRIAQDKEASLRMNPARPLFQMAGRLKLLPISRVLEHVNVRLRIPSRLLALELHRDHAIVKLRFHRDRRDDVTVNEMVDEMLGLAVLPLFRVNGERLLAKWVGIALA
jgi:hypothetical protein